MPRFLSLRLHVGACINNAIIKQISSQFLLLLLLVAVVVVAFVLLYNSVGNCLPIWLAYAGSQLLHNMPYFP